MTLYALALLACAPVAGPASSPLYAGTMPVDFGDCLDLEGQRELLAGVELEGGEQAAALARCNVQRGAAVKYGDGQASRADAAEKRLTWAIPLAGTGGAIIGAAIAALAAWAATQVQTSKPAGAP